jgi:ribonuclease D
MTELTPLTGADAAQLADLAAELSQSDVLGLDTEFLRERTYRAQLCLLQVATPTRCCLVDPLDNIHLSLLQPALVAAQPVKVLHAARQDLEVLFPLFGTLVNVFDTQVAAALAGMPAQVGYADLVKRLLGLELDKSHTRTDWSRRPLSAAQLIYAAEDVRHLAVLRQLLLEQLDKLGRLSWLDEELQGLVRGDNLFVDPDRAFERLKGIAELDEDRQRLARLLAAWRERRAVDRDRPRSWILDDAGLRALIARAPRDAAALTQLPELAPGFIEHSGTEILAVINAAQLPAVLPALPGRTRPDADATARLKKLSSVVGEVAAALGIGSEILATRRDLEQVAGGNAGAAPLRGWRRAAIGDALLAALRD